MSVAEVLGSELRVSSLEAKRPKFNHGLRLENFSSYDFEAPTTAAGAAESRDTRRTERNNRNYSHEEHKQPPVANILYRRQDKENRNSRQNLRIDEDKFGDKFGGWQEHLKTGDSDLFLDVLGGPGGTVLRQNGSPALTDPRFTHQQQQFQRSPYHSSDRRDVMGATRGEEMTGGMKSQTQRSNMGDVRIQTQESRNDDFLDNRHSYSSGMFNGNNYERRSLNLESNRGGAGAPVKDPWGKNVTRMPITLSRNDYGESNIREDIPGKATFDLDFTNEESKPYHPWGSQGGGAPIRDRDGNIVTHIYGKLEGRNGIEGEVRRNRRRQEVLYNELREGIKQHKENKEELTRYMKAPQTEMADLLLAGRVGKPRRDEITGEIGQQHLPNSDVSRVKMNYQPVPATQKKMYHDELLKMAEERQYQKQLEKLKERQESNAHFQNMDTTWGNFGGGAPKHHVIRKKANLTNCLFYPNQSNGEMEFRQIENEVYPRTGLGSFDYQLPGSGYEKPRAGEDNPLFLPSINSPRHVKNTARSSHRTLYDIIDENTFSGSPRGLSLAPYSTGGMF